MQEQKKYSYPNFPEDIDQTSSHFQRYIKLIESRPKRPKERREFFELHHIIPRSIGGSDNETNLISLTLREHFIAHLCCWKMTQNSTLENKGSLAYAFYQMSNNDKYERPLTGRMYENARNDFREV